MIPEAAWYSLAVVQALLAGSLCFVVWRVTGESRVERHQLSKLLFGVLDRSFSDSAAEVAQADIMRDSAAAEDELRMAQQMAIEEGIEEQTQQGVYDRDEATARYLMEQSGLDPDDPDHVFSWNTKVTGGHN